MLRGRRRPLAFVSGLLSLLTLSQLSRLAGGGGPPSERAEEASWIASSESWLDRTACHWFGVCGAAHLNRAGWVDPKSKKKQRQQEPVPESDGQDVSGAGPPGKLAIDLSTFWTSGSGPDPAEWDDAERERRGIPDYVLEHAPYVHLFSGEQFWPCDMAEHLVHTTPHLNYTPISAADDHPNLTDLSDLNRWGRFVYLKSDDNVEERPEWLGGASNIPTFPGRGNGGDDDDGGDGEDYEHEDGVSWAEWDGRIDGPIPDQNMADWYDVGIGDTVDKGGIRPNPTHGAAPPVPSDTDEGEELLLEPWAADAAGAEAAGGTGATRRTAGGRSDAPAVLIVVPKGSGVVDAFWFYFYSYNLGNEVFNVRFGNHVGDWEHAVVRFKDGRPKAMFFSEHNFGQAYSFEAVEKIGKRPVVYSATGTHAMYATAGVHPYVLPWGLLHDMTDRGPLWDPLLNSHAYTYDHAGDELRASNVTPRAPTDWFYFAGHWGDKFYPLSDPRQYRFAGQYHYVNGPLGPRFKNLGRKRICQGNGECVIKDWIGVAGAGEGGGGGGGRGERMKWRRASFFVYPDSCYSLVLRDEMGAYAFIFFLVLPEVSSVFDVASWCLDNVESPFRAEGEGEESGGGIREQSFLRVWTRTGAK
ncbi:hypothetical protein BDY21DRAFT_285749 [Lineolata rhizophorae]|uniref:Vacuolar protein sorting-associated protein 62 n=1 Tax=Lineolata rhizophorae TaxID=578093 RepID=A0A6A6P169_9PEZI|nr:hypothetical protein BDY21DRAFT_285749 [Lineolata rhizophorae]